MVRDAMSRRMFTSRPDWARASWGCLGVAIILLGFALSFILGVAFGWGLVGGAIALVGFVLAGMFRAMPQRTAAGRELLQHTLGFRLYMTTAEKTGSSSPRRRTSSPSSCLTRSCSVS
jgi:hypothetical protein